MTIFAPTDVRSVSVSGGCGQPHTAGDLPTGEKWALDCPPCEALLAGNPSLGWAHDPAAVRLTPDERLAFEQARDEAARRQHLTWGDPQAFAASLRDALGGGSRSLLDQIRDLSDEERTALKAVLGGDDAASPAKRTARKAAQGGE